MRRTPLQEFDARSAWFVGIAIGLIVVPVAGFIVLVLTSH